MAVFDRVAALKAVEWGICCISHGFVAAQKQEAATISVLSSLGIEKTQTKTQLHWMQVGLGKKKL